MNYNEFRDFVTNKPGLESDEGIIKAIMELARDEEDFFRIWEFATPEEEAYVVERGWELREYEDEADINWREGMLQMGLCGYGFID